MPISDKRDYKCDHKARHARGNEGHLLRDALLDEFHIRVDLGSELPGAHGIEICNILLQDRDEKSLLKVCRNLFAYQIEAPGADQGGDKGADC